MEALQRFCPTCGMTRIPDKKIVGTTKKKWMIYECRICHQKDIEPYTPRKIWDGNNFVDESYFEDETETK